MITTITLNTSVDKLYLVDQLGDYTVMRVKQVSNTAGGKGLNVSKVLRLLGGEVTALGFAGGFNGDYVSALLREQGVTARFTPIRAETRSCINVRELSTGRHTEFLEPGAAVTQRERQGFLESFLCSLPQSEAVTISGSVPGGIPDDFYQTLVEHAKKARVPVLVDTSGELLKQTVKAKPDLIKPNIDEIGQLLGRRAESLEEAVRAAVELKESGIRYVVVSLGKNGSVLSCGEGVYRAVPPSIRPVNTVGCGDSMVAGLAFLMAKGAGAGEMLRLATAVSAANALTMQTGFFEESDLKALYSEVTIEKLG